MKRITAYEDVVTRVRYVCKNNDIKSSHYVIFTFNYTMPRLCFAFDSGNMDSSVIKTGSRVEPSTGFDVITP